ncbi:MAG: choice-of-anchor B family protein [Acidobacteriota bacterium]
MLRFVFWTLWVLATVFPLIQSAEACQVAARLHYEKSAPEERSGRAFELAAPWLETGQQMDMTPIDYQLRAAVPCAGGVADGFPCSKVDLKAHLPLSAIGGGSGNDLWGWTDPLSGREYALVGRSTGTSFVDVTDPESPVFLGDLPTHSVASPWRDIKVYQNHAFIVADFIDDHGLQVFDLTQLRQVDTPKTFSETAHLDAFNRAHNIVLNTESGFAYAVGSDECSGGLLMIDVRTPTQPTVAGCYSDDGYTHDAQCVNYRGPDAEHQGKEICFASNEDTLTLVDVSDKQNPVLISRTGYDGWGYTHQGWLTEDHSRFLLDDEGDENRNGHNTRTYVWDLKDLDAPNVESFYDSNFPAVDHNQYVKDVFVYQANYSIGLRILEIDDAGGLEEVAFFDTHPESDSTSGGAWSVFPYFDSGTVVIGDINRGLFVLEPRMDTPATRVFEDDFEAGNTAAWSAGTGR